MADGGDVVEEEVDDPPSMRCPLVTVSHLPNTTAAGMSLYASEYMLQIYIT